MAKPADVKALAKKLRALLLPLEPYDRREVLRDINFCPDCGIDLISRAGERLICHCTNDE